MKTIFYPIYSDDNSFEGECQVGDNYAYTSAEGWHEVNKLREATGLLWRLARETDDEVTVFLTCNNPSRVRPARAVDLAASEPAPKQKTVRVLREWEEGK